LAAFSRTCFSIAADGAMLRKVICKGYVMSIVLPLFYFQYKTGKSRAIFISRLPAKKAD
jgi:hypothetical protein